MRTLGEALSEFEELVSRDTDCLAFEETGHFTLVMQAMRRHVYGLLDETAGTELHYETVTLLWLQMEAALMDCRKRIERCEPIDLGFEGEFEGLAEFHQRKQSGG